MGKKIVRLTESELTDLFKKSDLSDNIIQKILNTIIGKGIKQIKDKGKRDKAIDDVLDTYDIESPYESKPSTSESEYLDKVLKLLKAYEGFRKKAYRDAVGVWTIGFGSTYVDGKPVKKGDTITMEKAMNQKKSDINKFKEKIISQIGRDNWNRLDLDTKVVLTSIAYNYGSLPSVLVEPARSGDKQKMRQVILNTLSRHNGGVNAWRRGDEAAILASGESKRAPEYNV